MIGRRLQAGKARRGLARHPISFHILRVRVSIFVLTASFLALPAQLPAQRMSCAHADSVARMDALSLDAREVATVKLIYCPDIRVAAITSLLRRGESNPASDTLGRMVAWALFDPGLVDSVAVLAKDARQPRQRRVLFVGMLSRYAECQSGTDTCGSDDRHPLPPADRDRARAAIDWVARHDLDARVRAYAAQISADLAELWTAGLQTPSSPLPPQ